MKKSIILLCTSSLLSCQNAQQAPPQYKTEKTEQKAEIVDLQQVNNIPLPEGYQRLPDTEGSFAAYLGTIKLKKDKTVYLFDGRKKGNQSAQFAVLDVSVGNRDLQQCADAVMRLRGEYLYAQKAFDKIAFHAVEGQLMRFVDWANGSHNLLNIKVLDAKLNTKADVSYPNFLKYMNFVFAYASTLSLEKELTPLPTVSGSSISKISKTTEIRAGDVFIKGGAPGHAVTVVDVAIHKKTGKKIFLIAQSYMPAQDIHILKNPNNTDLSPWYGEDFGDVLKTPEWDFDKKALRRFAN
jgi:hypothetical protein